MTDAAGDEGALSDIVVPDVVVIEGRLGHHDYDGIASAFASGAGS